MGGWIGEWLDGRRRGGVRLAVHGMTQPTGGIRYHVSMNGTRELSDYLAALENEDSYLVDCVLGKGDVETTEKVYRIDADGCRQGPYIRKRFARDSGMGEAYERIYKACLSGAAFRHIPRVLAFYRNEAETVVVIEYVAGDTLRAQVDKKGAGFERACLLFPALCMAARELQERFTPPLIHRDLKPDNIIVRDASVAIIDFGIARAYRHGARADTTHLGTRAYAPPEQYGYAQTSQRSDVYALGGLLFFLLSGRDPSPADLRAGFERLSLPWKLRLVIQTACAFDPAARFANARELQDAFAQAIGQGEGVSAASLSWREGGGRHEDMPAAFTPKRNGGGGDGDGDGAWNSADSGGGNASLPGGRGTPVPGGSASVFGDSGDQPQSYANPPAKQRRRGLVRNILIASVFALFFCECLRCVFDPSIGQYQGDLIENAFIYGVFDPLIIGAVCFGLLDRKHLRERRAWAARIDKRYDKWIVIGLVLVAFVLAIAVGFVLGLMTM